MPLADRKPAPSTEVHTLGAMTRAGVRLEIQHLSRLYQYILVNGRLHHPASRLAGVILFRGKQPLHTASIGFAPGPQDGQPWGHFELSCIVPGDFDPLESSIAFQFLDGALYLAGWNDIHRHQEELRRERAGGEQSNTAYRRFFEMLRQTDARSVLEIGSRARSQVSRRELFGGMDYLGMDILDGENVDVVGDAHELSAVVGDRRFDAVFCCSTFEHLLMPWKVALEINRVLRPGGVCFVSTHQSLGMHDMPWDYWRYSDTAWHGLFNVHTGFEILDTYLGEPMHLVPFEYHDHWKGFEGAVGFASSAMVCRKVGDTTLTWNVPAREVAIGEYPE